MNRPGVLICERCGTNLATGESQIATKALKDDQAEQIQVPRSQPAKADASSAAQASQPRREQKPAPKPADANQSDAPTPPSAESTYRRGTDEFPKGGTLRLEVEGSSKSVQVPLTVHNRQIVLGRRDPATGVLPDIDLTPFAGYRMGVSRRHGLIRYSEGKFLDLFDQGSSNGTFLNGQRMDAHYPYRLRDGDRIRLGQITIRLHFDPSNASAVKRDVKPAKDEKRSTSPLGAIKPSKPSPPQSAAPGASPAPKKAAANEEETLKPQQIPSSPPADVKPQPKTKSEAGAGKSSEPKTSADGQNTKPKQAPDSNKSKKKPDQ